MRSRVRLLAAATALPLAMVISGAFAQDTVRLTVATGIGPTVPTGLLVRDHLAPLLVEESGGRIDVQAELAGSLCSETSCVEQAQLGHIDIGSISAANLGSFGSTLDILNLPFIFKDYESAESLIDGWMGEELKARTAEEMGLKVLAYVSAYGFRDVINSAREVRVPGDLQGIKIRTTAGPVEINLFRAWGAVPTPYAWANIYEGLQTGVVQGMYGPAAYMAAIRLHEVAPFMTRTGGAFNVHLYFMDLERFNGLPEWARDAIERAGVETQRRSWDIDRQMEVEQLRVVAEEIDVYDPTPEEISIWRNGATDAWVAVRDNYDHDMARRALTEQGMQDFIERLEAAGALD